MEQYQINTVRDVFKRCYGLRQALESQDGMVAKSALESLQTQTGFRKEFMIRVKNTLSLGSLDKG